LSLADLLSAPAYIRSGRLSSKRSASSAARRTRRRFA